MKRLLLRADDAGSCESANLAIAEACAFGLLKNVSVMACGPAFEEAARMLPGFSGVAFGLHVCLNAEWTGPKWGPVLGAAAVPSLVDAHGYFLPTPALLKEKGFFVEEAEAEVKAQLARLRASGLPVTYLDEHMGVGWVPGLRERLHALAAREGLLVRSDSYTGLPPLPEGAKGHGDLPWEWAARLEAAPDGVYLVVTHPGRDAPDMHTFVHPGLEPGQVARERDAERRALTDPGFAEALTRLGVKTIRFDEV